LTELGPENQNWRYAASSHTRMGTYVPAVVPHDRITSLASRWRERSEAAMMAVAALDRCRRIGSFRVLENRFTGQAKNTARHITHTANNLDTS
jgi:hypothetical protein